MDQAELAEELDHQRELVKELRRRRRHLERMHVIKGIETDPHIVMQIEDISRQIKEREIEIESLQTLAVEDKFPLREVEYQALLAQEWDTLRGRPTVAGSTRLELTRLRSGITPQRAKELEAEIREALANEQLIDLNPEDVRESFYDFMANQGEKEKRLRFRRKFEPVVRTLRLHSPLVVPWLLQSFETMDFPDMTQVWHVFRSNPTEFSGSDIKMLALFLAELEQKIGDQKNQNDT